MTILRITGVRGELVGLRFADVEILRSASGAISIESGSGSTRYGVVIGADELAALIEALAELAADRRIG